MEYYGFTLAPAYADKPHQLAFADLFEAVETADRLGFDGWFLAEHHGNAAFSLLPSPNLVLAALAQRTKRLRLGNMVNLIPFHHPYRLAEEIRLLDQLTGGRLEVGFGRGQVRTEQAAFGTVRDETVEMFDVGLDIIHRLLRGEQVDYQTRWWNGRGAFAAVEAIQTPHPPIWMSAASDSSIEKSARLGMHCATALLTRKVADAHLKEYKRRWDQYNPGRKGEGKFAIAAEVAIGNTFDEAYAQVRKGFERRKEHFARSITDRPEDNDSTYTTHKPNYDAFAAASVGDLVENHLLIAGTVAQCIDQIAAVRDRGIDAVLLSFSSEDRAFSKRSIELFGREVIPAVERRSAPANAIPAN